MTSRNVIASPPSTVHDPEGMLHDGRRYELTDRISLRHPCPLSRSFPRAAGRSIST